MSVARKCNKCGICFDPLNEEGRMARFENPIFQTSSDVKNNARGYLLAPELGVTGTIDLCPDCSDKFLEFFLVNKKKKDVIAEAIERLIRPLDGDFDGDTDIRDRILEDSRQFRKDLAAGKFAEKADDSIFSKHVMDVSPNNQKEVE